MDSIKQAKFSRLIQRELGQVFLTDGKRLLNDSFISVTKVVASADLVYVKVYLSFLNEDDPENLIKEIKAHSNEIKRLLVNRIRNKVRRIPELNFFYDDTMDYVEKMDAIFKELNSKKKK
jgi:ribosome-binding factor A